MRFYEAHGQVYCRDCRDGLLQNVDRALSAYAGHDVSGEEPERKSDYEALGSRPWAGNDEPERYIQCDGCNGQWGPDA